jgi:hypothetical protein
VRSDQRRAFLFLLARIARRRARSSADYIEASLAAYSNYFHNSSHCDDAHTAVKEDYYIDGIYIDKNRRDWLISAIE